MVSRVTTVKLDELNQVNDILRKIGHGLSYGILYFLWFRAIRAHMGLSLGRACLSSLGLCLSVAMTDEGCQWFSNSRGASIRDVILDMSGASLAALITAAVHRPWDPAAPIPIVSLWRKPHVLDYWLPPVLWSLVVLAVQQRLVPVETTLAPLKWLVSWFAVVDSFQLRSINLFLWNTGQALTFGILYVLWFRAFLGYAGAGRRRACLYALGLCLYVPLLQEGFRILTLTRATSMHEVILDLSGVSLAVLVTFAIWPSHSYVVSRATIAAPQSFSPGNPGRDRGIEPSGTTSSFWRKPNMLHYWLPPVLGSLAVLVVSRGLVPVEITLGPLKWLVSWFAWVDSFQLRSVNLFLWKTGQALTFGILYVLWFRAFQGYAGAGRGRACLLALGLCLLVAMTHEGLQIFTRTRGVSMYEVILEMSGSSLVALLTLAFWTPGAKAIQVSGLTGRPATRPE